MKADSSISRPSITVSLHASHDELDLSGKSPFDFDITATLCADKAVVIYSSDTILSPVAALLQGGLEFTPLGEEALLPQITRFSSPPSEPTRTWNSANFIVLDPGAPKSIRIPFGALEPLAGDQFDLRFWMNTAAFKAGNAYKARLPSTAKVTWWRIATAAEVKSGTPALPGGFLSALTSAVISWWNGPCSVDEGVPVLPEAEQLTVVVEGDGVSFTCKGVPTEIPRNG
jgi:hypothetical protein